MSRNARAKGAADRLAGVYDVIIAGAGPAGSFAACQLARGGLRVLMLDRLRPRAQPLGETLPGAARRLLAREGLDDLARPGPHHMAVSGGMAVWGDAVPVASDALRDPYGPGLRLDRARFDADLRQAALQAGAEWLRADVALLRRDGPSWAVFSDADGPLRALRATVVIDATGRAARLVRMIGQARLRGTPLVALYQMARPERNGDLARSLIEALPDGWAYAGRLACGRWAIGYHTRPKDAARLQRRPGMREAILAEAPQLAACLGRLDWQGSVCARDARSLATVAPCGTGWFAVGDAALAFDPIAGQGLFNALRSGSAAARAILAAPGCPDGAAYAAELQQAGAVYAARRQTLYRAERRWSAQPFWQDQAGLAEAVLQA